MRSRLVFPLAAMLAISLAPAAGFHASASSSAVAAAQTDLGVASFGRILVDPGNSHVFVSSPAGNSITVLDFAGHIVTTIVGEPGAEAMALTGTTLYVARTADGSIDQIDTVTLKRTRTLVTGLPRPNDLVLAGNKLWIPGGTCGSWGVALLSVDPAPNPPVVTAYPSIFTANNVLAYCALFASNPATNPGSLLAFSRSSPTTLLNLDVSSGSPVQQKLVTVPIDITDIAMTADGTHFIVDSHDANPAAALDEYNASTLAPDGISYPAKGTPTSVATSAAHGGLMLGGSWETNLYDVYAYLVDGLPPVTLATTSFSGTTLAVPSRALAIQPDGSSAFMISTGTGGEIFFNVVSIPAPGPPQPPTSVYTTAQVDALAVNWTPPLDQGGYPVTGYTVTASPGGMTAVVTAPTRTAVLSPLAVDVPYTVTVTATNLLGTSIPSAPTYPTPPLPRPPSAPTNLNAVPGDGEAFVSWSPPSDPGERAITGYEVSPCSVVPSLQCPAGHVTTVSGSPPSTSAIAGGLNNGSTYAFVVRALSSAGSSHDSAPSNAVTLIQGGNYHPLTPARILDTRTGVGGPVQPVGNGEIRSVQITGKGMVPASGVSAVVLNVTVTGPTAPGFLTVYPARSLQPDASNLNFVAGETVPNLVEVALGAGGQVDLVAQFASRAGRADVIFDVAGWVGVAINSSVRDGLYNALTPGRIMDTRSGTGVRKGPLGPGQTVTLNVGAGGVPASGVSAVVLNVTVTGPTAPSYLTVFPADAKRPTASNLNFNPGQTVPNRVIVRVPAGGLVSFYNAAGSVQVIADVAGWFTDSTSTAGGARFSGNDPTRILDTRDPGIGPLDGGSPYQFQLLDQSNNPVVGVSALVVNLTVTNPTAASYLTLWPDGPPLPTVSDLNFTANETVPNLVVVMLGPDATIDLYNAAGRTDVILDLVGYYGAGVPAPAGSPMLAFGLHARPVGQRAAR